MLSQQVSAAGCQLSTDIDADVARGVLTEAVTEFQSILEALEFGDADRNIQGAETRRKTIADIAAVQEVWAPFKDAADAMISGDVSDANLQMLLDQDAAVLEAANSLVIEVTSQYSNPAVLVKADAFLINIAGRQRMLIQQMSKDSCVLGMNPATQEASEALKSAMQMFTTSLDALQNGLPSAGIRRPPTPAIGEGLAEVLVNWNDVKPLLDSMLAGTSLDADTTARKFQDFNAMMATMNNVVGMYIEATVVK
jgi:hypothetical protein